MSAPNQTERDLLAAILRNPDLLSESDRLRAEDLTRPHGLTLEAMRAIQASGALLDHRTLRLELERGGNLVAAGGPAFIGELITGDVRLESVRRFVEALAEDALRRRASRLCSELRERLEGGDAKAGAALSEGIAKLSRLAEGGSESTSCEGAGLLRACTGAIESLLSGDGLGRSTGFPGLDALGVRLVPGEVLVIAAGTSRGKSALGAQIAYHVAKGAGRAAFASLEMSQAQTLRRFVALEARVPLDVMRANADNPAMVQRLSRAASCVADSGLIVADLSRDTRLSRLIASAQAARTRGGLDVLVIDYLGLLNLDGARGRASRYEVTTELSREVKLSALRLDVAVILLVQLSRGPESRDDGKPRLSDLRDSGAIEQDADAVLLIHRAATSSEGALLVAKNRNGPCGEVPIMFDGATFTYRERTEGPGDYAQH